MHCVPTCRTRLGQGYAVVYPAGQGQRQSQMLGSYQIGLNFMSGIALFVGAFLIYNAFAMNVVERTREFGMLRTIGMTRRQIVGQVDRRGGRVRDRRFGDGSFIGYWPGSRADTHDGCHSRPGVGQDRHSSGCFDHKPCGWRSDHPFSRGDLPRCKQAEYLRSKHCAPAGKCVKPG